MSSPTLKNTTGDGVNLIGMEDATERVDETRLAATIEDDSTVVDYPPTGASELAWSIEEPWADVPTAKASHPRSHALARWAIAITAVLIAGSAALWFGSVFYHDEQSTPPKLPVAKTAPEKTPAPSPPPPVAAPVPPPPPVEAPHPPPKYPWVSIAVSPHATPDGGRSVGSGYGYTQSQSITSALIACRNGGNNECVEESAIADGCVAISVGRHGEYGTGAGSTRTEAISTARANQPGAVQSFCSWDGNGVPAIFVPNGS